MKGRNWRDLCNWCNKNLNIHVKFMGSQSTLNLMCTTCNLWARYFIRYSDWLRAGRSGDRISVGMRYSAPVQTGPGAHPASCTMGSGSFPGVKSGQGVTLTPHPLLVLWSWKGSAIPLLPLWAVRPVQSLSACTRVTFTYTLHVTCFKFYVWMAWWWSDERNLLPDKLNNTILCLTRSMCAFIIVFNTITKWDFQYKKKSFCVTCNTSIYLCKTCERQQIWSFCNSYPANVENMVNS